MGFHNVQHCILSSTSTVVWSRVISRAIYLKEGICRYDGSPELHTPNLEKSLLCSGYISIIQLNPCDGFASPKVRTRELRLRRSLMQCLEISSCALALVEGCQWTKNASGIQPTARHFLGLLYVANCWNRPNPASST